MTTSTKHTNRKKHTKTAKQRTATTTAPTTARATHSADAATADDLVTIETPTGSLEHYQRFLPAAEALDPAAVRRASIDVSLVLYNAARGVHAVLARRDEIAKLPNVSIEQIDALANIGDALAYAVGVVHRYVPIVGDMQAAMTHARQLRAKLLAKADVLVHDGIVPAATVKGIRKGKGIIDTANDCVQLAALFQQHAAELAKSVVVDPADIQIADTVGRKLLATLHRSSVKRTPAPELVAAANARDRLWTLFEQTWERNVWVAGAYLFHREVDAHVPLLMSAARPRRTTKPTPAPPITTTPPTTSVAIPPPLIGAAAAHA